MFRPMRRFKQQLSREKCEEILTDAPRGVLALSGDDGYPYAVPLNFVYENGFIYFHCAAQGHKLDAVKSCGKASFCVLDNGTKSESDWSMYFNSVVAFGKIRVLEDRDKTIEKVRLLGLKYYPDAREVEEEIEKFRDRVCCLELEIEHMSGKHVHEK